jgi:uncharacterized membrane protein YbhN (UPF0104 family)
VRSRDGSARPGGTGRRRALWPALIVLVVVAALYVGVPRIAGLDETWGLLAQGDPWWFAVAVGLEAASYGGYVVLFRGLFVRPGSPIGWRESYAITMAGVAATRLLAAGGAGGIALTGWALSRSGMSRAAVLRGLTTFYVALYGVYMLALVGVGTGLRIGLFTGPAPVGLTVVPAIFGAVVITVALAAALLPSDLGGRVRALPSRHARLRAVLGSAASAAALIASGVRGALARLRARDPALIGAVAWWAFDIGVLWACFHAFGDPPSPAVLVMAYFTGMLGNLLPLPGGVGGVEGGMIAALIGFGVASGLAVVAVLSYRAFAFWLPTLPGALAYVQLRRTVDQWQG